MKTPHRGEFISGLAIRMLPALFLVNALATEAPREAIPAEPKTHTLFMGTDISVEVAKKLYPIRNVDGSSFIVMMKGEPTAVPMRGEPHNLKIDHGLKLTSVSANLADLKSERAYSPGNDPRMRRQREALLVDSVISDQAALAVDKISFAQSGFGVAVGPVIGQVADPMMNVKAQQAAAAAATSKSMTDLQGATNMMNSDMGTAGSYHTRAESDLAEEMFDAVEVTFKVSSPTRLASPYLVVITRFHEKDAKPGEARNSVHAQSLDPIDDRPRNVEIMQGGFPRGFVIEDLQVHLYNRGEEIATDVVSKRVPLTRDEAFKYVKIDYLLNHKGANLPATPALGKLGPDERSRLTSDQLRDAYFVKVSKDGLPLAAFADEGCTQAADSAVASLVAGVRFYPALENGKAVDGIARLLFPELRL